MKVDSYLSGAARPSAEPSNPKPTRRKFVDNLKPRLETRRRASLEALAKSYGTMSAFQNGAPPARVMEDDSDVEEEALVADYREQVSFQDGMDELEPTTSLTMAQQTDDIQSRLAAAAQPLDFSAPLEVKFQSYDSYCSLFHFILNSEGPVDLEPPSVSKPAGAGLVWTSLTCT